MAKRWQFDPDVVDLRAAMTFVVVRRQGKRLIGYRVEVATEVVELLRNICASTLIRIRGLDARSFGPDTRIDPASEYLAVPGIPLLPDSAEPEDADFQDDDGDDEGDIAADVALPEILGRASSLDRLSARDLPSGFLLYAVVFGDEP